MIAREADAVALAETLDRDIERLTSPLAAWETVAGLCRSYRFSTDQARGIVRAFFDEFEIRTVGIGDAEYDLAAAAYARYGRGRHPAALNMGDCFAYACAKTNASSLLYVGADFALTDLARASPLTTDL